jgi:hypothetical protein
MKLPEVLTADSIADALGRSHKCDRGVFVLAYLCILPQRAGAREIGPLASLCPMRAWHASHAAPRGLTAKPGLPYQ